MLVWKSDLHIEVKLTTSHLKPLQIQVTNVFCLFTSLDIVLGRFQGTTDANAIQFFLKNIHPAMRTAASVLLGQPESLQSRPNVFGELMRILISPSQAIEEAVSWALNGGDPDITLHMRMLTNR